MTAKVVEYSQADLDYGMAFFGFTDAEWQAVVDSLDLSAYM